MGIAFGLAPHTLFKYCYGDKKKRFILKLEFVDSDSNATNEELLTVNQEISAPHHINGNIGVTAALRKQQHITFDYIVKHTDYFLTPRTPTEIRKDLESIYNLQMHPSNIYNYFKNNTNNELIKTKINPLTSNGTIAKKGKVILIKATHPHRLEEKAEDKKLIQRLKKQTEDSIEIYAD